MSISSKRFRARSAREASPQAVIARAGGREPSARAGTLSALGLLTAFAGAVAAAESAQTGVVQNDRASWRENARAHAEIAPAPPADPDLQFPPPDYRSYDATANNQNHPTWGCAGARYRREASGSHYADGRSQPSGASRPSARLISNLLVSQSDLIPPDDRGLSTCTYEFGQFLDHDIGQARGGFTESFDIPVPLGDLYFDPGLTGNQLIFLDRSDYDHATGMNNPRQQINNVTSYIDASQVYGSDAARAAWLRSFSGGHLKVIHEAFGDMLPFNDGTLANDDPVGLPATSLRAAGDTRANEQPGLTVFHTVFLREHNWQADRLHTLHSSWNDERLYQEARKIIGAEMQVIVTKEFLPALLGRGLPPYTGYKSNVNPGLSNSFATAAYRIGHSMVGDDIDLLDDDFEEFGVLELADVFFNPSAIPDAGGVNPFVRYFATDIEQTIDTMIVDPLRNFLFGPPGAGGFDLAALNIQRGRDHGLADYNTLRADCSLPRVNTFAQITTNPVLALALQTLYGSVNNIDPWIGMLAEDHVPGASVGPTHMAALLDQFTRLRDGDRYWYQNGQFLPSDLAMLESTRLSDIMRRHTGISVLQTNMFFAAELAAPACTADMNGDGVVNESDLAIVLGNWGAIGASPADLNADGIVGGPDLAAVLGSWGACP